MRQAAEVTIWVELAYFNVRVADQCKQIKTIDFNTNEYSLIDYLQINAAHEILWENNILISIHAQMDIFVDEALERVEITFDENPLIAFRLKLKHEGVLLRSTDY